MRSSPAGRVDSCACSNASRMSSSSQVRSRSSSKWRAGWACASADQAAGSLHDAGERIAGRIVFATTMASAPAASAARATSGDVIEYMLAGATAVQVGTATFVQPAAMTTIIDDLVAFCVHREIARVSQLTGGVVIEEADEPDLAWLNPPT